MSDTAFLFPGQGAQYTGMAADLYEAFGAARQVLDQANDVLGFDLKALMFTGAEDELRQTDITQPALFAHSMAALAAMDDGALRSMGAVAGHSLGEYSALAASGALSFEDALRLVRLRGELMAQAGNRRRGSMAAILGLDDAAVETLCTDVSEPDSIVQAANYNAPGQIVISGDEAAVARAVEEAPARGARRALALPVSGAFHSVLMDAAAGGLSEGLEKVDICTPRVPVFMNVTAEPTTDPDEIRRRLLEQLTSPVRWSHTLVRMQQAGIGSFVEVGAGRVLSGLVKRTLGRDAVTSARGRTEDYPREAS
ncbi:MAG: [acyl-carrier-protein] S-malonyltransferase [Bacteroidetes bacterium CG12_big_fil_rev_8_21_14_0_65_60_17]|nr:MAG: [acyl-carrier-protein] S-malonyltransferase [Bacteroidetes bacterium CG12_big_fil_rev_8_21_14_0_65_60_17]